MKSQYKHACFHTQKLNCEVLAMKVRKILVGFVEFSCLLVVVLGLVVKFDNLYPFVGSDEFCKGLWQVFSHFFLVYGMIV